MYKLIATDLDETLLDDTHHVNTANLEAIKKARALGVKIVPATGRGFMAVQNVLAEIAAINMENEYTLSFNGAILTENKGNKILLFEGMDFEKAKELFLFGLTKNVCIRIQTMTDIYAYNLNDDERARFERQGTPLIELSEPSIDFLQNEKISKMVFQNIDVPYLMSFEEELAPITDNEVTVSYSSNRYMELNKIGVDKGVTLLKLAEILGIKQEEIIAVGDNYNDMPMLKVAGLSVAAGNAVAGVKSACDYVCQNDNNQGVLAEVIKKFILPKK